MSEITKSKRYFEKGVFIAPGAQIVGNVNLLEGANIWHNAVLRGDEAPITVGCASNVQDNCTLHCDRGIPLLIGKNVTVGHNAVLHSCTIGDGSLIGIGAVVLNNVIIGKGCLIAAGAVVTPRTVVPDGSLMMGSPAKVKRLLSENEQQGLLNNAMEYTKLAVEYKEKETREISENCILSKGLSQSRLNTIKTLVELCDNHEHLNLKLNWSLLENRNPGCANDIFYYKNAAPVGYLGFNAVLKTPCIFEVTGMVLPCFRRRGIFSAMFGKAVEVCRSRGANKLILVTDSSLASGVEFAKDKGFSFEHKELAMKCKKRGLEAVKRGKPDVQESVRPRCQGACFS